MRSAPWRPGPGSTALLTALLGGGQDEHLVRWASANRQPDPEVEELLPFAYPQLAGLAPAAEVTKIAREAHLATMRGNLLRMNRLVPAIRALEEAQIRAVVLKGAALLLRFAPGYGARPMLDVDLLIAPEDVPRAVEVLRSAGWQAFGDAVPAMLERRLRVDHALTLVADRLVSLDLHWAVAPGVSKQATTRWLRAAQSVPGDVGPLLVPSPAHMLVQTLVHAVQPSQRRSCRWVLDAAVIIDRAGAQLTWAEVCEWAEAERVTQRVHEALRTLAALLPDRVPATVLQQLAAVTPSPEEARELALYAAPAPHPWWRVLRWHWHRFLRLRRTDTRWSRRGAVAGFADYLGLRRTLRTPMHGPLPH